MPKQERKQQSSPLMQKNVKIKANNGDLCKSSHFIRFNHCMSSRSDSLSLIFSLVLVFFSLLNSVSRHIIFQANPSFFLQEFSIRLVQLVEWQHLFTE